MHNFETVLCVDGSCGKESKRPVYRYRRDEGPVISRFRHSKGVLSVLDRAMDSELPRPILITADVPIGLPAKFDQVWRQFGGFLPWLDARATAGWDSIVVDSVAKQTAESPFVVCQKDEKKARGQFPLRKCDEIAQGESVYWCVGVKQVGKAALQFWRDTLVPLRRYFGSEVGVWPFDCISDKAIVIAECYPAILHARVWGRRVTKSNPLDVVDAVFDRLQRERHLSDEKTWLHAASSEDDFDIFTVAVVIAEVAGEPDKLFSAPESATPVEGWMLMLPPS